MRQPDPDLIDIEAHLQELFELDEKVAKANPSILPLETPEELRDFLIKEHHSDTYLLRTDGGQPIGYISLINLPGGSLEVLNLGVDPGFQREGYGRKLMAFAEDKASQLGKSKTMLVTNIKNDQAVNFYKALGYSIVKTAKNYYGDGEDRYIFEKAHLE